MDPNKNQKNGNNSGNNNNRNNWRGVLSLVAWALMLTLLVSAATTYMRQSVRPDQVEIPYSEFLQLVEDGKVTKVEVSTETGLLLITPVEGFSYTDAEGNNFVNEKPADDDKSSNSLLGAKGTQGLTLFTLPIESGDSLSALLTENDVEFSKPYVPQLNPVLSFLVSTIVPFALIMLMFSLLMRVMAKKGGGGFGGMGSVGKANAKVYMEKSTGVTFKDVAGQDEAKESLVEIIDFLHNPQRYTEIGAKLPKGALLVGPPGTGKTLLAKAVAGEANVPFFSISGSDFVEMFVGVGASRVRDLFKEAAKVAPCIIFIDEVDTIGKTRDTRFGGNDEREQTLNQLLAELDGFDPSKGIIVLAATNRPEVLDKALLRPGRFDRRIIVDRPNLAGRLTTLEVHTRNIRLSEDVNLRKIALATAGTVGADLANLVNEAALRAVRLGRKAVNQQDLLSAFELVIAGSEKKGTVLTEFEKKLVAYHEVGHAMVAYKQKNTEPVQKITIVPHTQGSLGYTLLMPEEDKTELRTRDELLARITVSMGGRAAEQVVLNTMTNGASQDIQDATGVARNMVVLYGMSEKFGMMGLASQRNQYLEGGFSMDCAQNTAADVDSAVYTILNECYDKAIEIITDSREDIDKVVDYLLEKETITGGEMMAILEGRDPATADNFGDFSSDPDHPGIATDPQGIEAPARHVHMVSEKIEAPAPAETSASEESGEASVPKDSASEDLPPEEATNWPESKWPEDPSQTDKPK